MHTNVAFGLTRKMPVGHERGREVEVEGEGQKGRQKWTCCIYII